MSIRIAKNGTASNVVLEDLGDFTIPAFGQEDLSEFFSLSALSQSDSLQDEVISGNLIINDGVRDLSLEESIEILNFSNKLEAYNPPEATYMIQANLARSIFLTHSEFFRLESGLKNAIIDTFNGQDKVASSFQISFDGKSSTLLPNTTPVLFDNFNSIASWVSDSPETTLSLESTIIHEGSGSAKVAITANASATSWRRIKRTFGPAVDWSTYKYLTVWCFGIAGAKVRLNFKSGNEYTTFDQVLAAGWQQLTFDISSYTRTAVTFVKFQIQKNQSPAINIYFDLAQFVLTTAPFYASGNVASITKTVAADIGYIYFDDLAFTVEDVTDYTVEISLDGGTNYHLLDLGAGDKAKWLDTSTWTELFGNKKNLKLRITLTTTDTALSPNFDDYIVMWKLYI